jgi:hypothetical protein
VLARLVPDAARDQVAFAARPTAADAQAVGDLTAFLTRAADAGGSPV